MAGRRTDTDMTKGNPMSIILKFTLMLLLGNVAQQLYNIADTIIVGRSVDPLALAAVGSTGTVMFLMFGTSNGMVSGFSIVTSQRYGAGDERGVKASVTNGLYLSLIIAALITIVGLVFMRPLLVLMNTPEPIFDYALTYISTICAGIVCVILYNYCASLMRAVGNSLMPLIFLICSAATNVGLDIWFIVGLRMGTFGAALATVIAQGLAVIPCIIFIYAKMPALRPSKEDWKLNPAIIKEQLKLGIPMAIKSASISFSKLFINSFVNNYGVVVSAVAGVGNKICSVPMLVSNSVNTAGSSMIGQNIGGAKYDRVPKIMLAIFAICGSITGLCMVLVILFPSQIFMIFTSDASIIPVALEYLPILIINFVGAIVRAPSGAFINGSANYKINFVVAILDAFVARVGLGLLFGVVFKMEYFGFWLGDALSGPRPLFIGGAFLLSGKWKTRKYVIQEEE